MPNKFPSDEEFERALAAMLHVRWGTDEIAANTHRQFQESCPLHRVSMFVEGPAEFHLLLFFETDEDVLTCQRTGVVDRIEAFVRQQLERVGRADGRSIAIRLELDSHENVNRTCRGNYFLRLRMGSDSPRDGELPE